MYIKRLILCELRLNRTAACLLALAVCLSNSLWGTPAEAEPYRIYYGNVHNHSNASDGKGSPEEAYHHARHVAGLDFFGLSDHAERLSAEEWESVKQVAQAHNQDGVFVTFWGFEWSHYFHGHVTVIQTEDITSAGKSNTNSFTEMVQWLSERNGIAFFNHPGRQDKTGSEFSHFSTPPSPRFVGIDLFNKIYGFEKFYYNDGYRRDDGRKGFYDEALAAGWRVGAAGSDDNHEGTWGSRTDFRLAVLASAKTRSAIIDAFIERRFYATLDKNLSLFFEICGQPMGSVVEAGSCEAVIRLADGDAEPFEQIMLFKNGSLHQIRHPYESSIRTSIPLTTREGDYYYVKVTQSDGDEAISSPIWVYDPSAPSARSIIQPSRK